MTAPISTARPRSLRSAGRDRSGSRSLVASAEVPAERQVEFLHRLVELVLARRPVRDGLGLLDDTASSRQKTRPAASVGVEQHDDDDRDYEHDPVDAALVLAGD